MPPILSKPFTSGNVESRILTRDNMSVVGYRGTSASGEGDLFMPEACMMDWTVAGVPGGIPTGRTQWEVDVTEEGFYHMEGDGVTDDTVGLQRLLENCLPNQYIYLPAGTYKIGSLANGGTNSDYSLRGDGIGETILKLVGGYINLGSSPTRPNTTMQILDGATKGSAVVTIADTTTVSVGKYVRIIPAPMPPWGHNLDAGEGATDGYSTAIFLHLVESKTPTTVTITPALPFDISGLQPYLIAYPSDYPLTTRVGIEELTFDLSTGASAVCVQIQFATQCWIKNCEVNGAYGRVITFSSATHCEVRGLYSHDVQSSESNHEGLTFSLDACWNKVEDCIFINGGAPPIVFGDGATAGGCGNVVAYNYSIIDDFVMWDFSDNHGPHAMLNLWEGNQFGQYKADGFFGSCSHNAFFRNHITSIGSGVCVSLKRLSNYFSFVGNILGYEGLVGLYELETSGDPSVCIWELGNPDIGNRVFSGTFGGSGSPNYAGRSNNRNHADNAVKDLNVKFTLHRHGNWVDSSTITGAGADIVWAEGYSQTLPASLVYTSQPSWWGAMPWPPIGPDVSSGPVHQMVNDNPAKVRYDAMP